MVTAPTTSTVEISGRVKNVAGKSISGAVVTLTDDLGNVRSVKADARGLYRFTEVQAGRTYIINVAAKFYTFAPQAVTVTEELAGFDLTLQQ